MNLSIAKKLMLVGASFLLLAIGVGIGLSARLEYLPVSNTQSAIIAPANAPAAAVVASAPESALVKVTRVIDGDTIEISGGERVRYIGIDTPETVDPRKPVQCFGIEASNKNKELVLGKTVRLEKDITDRDKYHRLLRYVWLDNTMINRALVEEGFAHSYSYPPDVKYQDQLVAAERQAREAKRGLWDACPTSISPSASTSTSAGVTVTATTDSGVNNSCTIKGNISVSGEKIYHLPGCAFYAKTRIDESHGERWFCSETEARTAGWRKALNCQ